MEFPIQMYDPKREYNLHKTDIDNAIHEVLNHGKFINGPEINELEDELSKFTGSQCVTLSNGTDALQVALLALDVGIDDEVYNSFSFLDIYCRGNFNFKSQTCVC